MDEIKIKNAQEATAIKEKNAITTDKLLQSISCNVNTGCMTHVGYIPMSVIYEVIKLGFSVKQGEGHMKEPITTIEW